jgi:2,4-dienoyl-CoA reductase (NADPH2)
LDPGGIFRNFHLDRFPGNLYNEGGRKGPSVHERFRIRDLEMLISEADRLGLELPVRGDVSPLFQELRLKTGHVLKNRFAALPMEGADADESGTPGALTFRRYRRFATGGFGLVWFEACAVVPEGRSNPHQLRIHEGNVGIFGELVRETRRASASASGGTPPVLVLQITHSGRYARPEGRPAPMIIHHSPELDRRQNLPSDYQLVPDEYLDELQDKYVEAAGFAALAGFDGVDIKSCHGYLLSELLAAHTREHGRYGGSFKNRARFLKTVVDRICHEVPGIFVTTRLSIYDALPHPYGFGVSREDRMVPDLEEPRALVHDLARTGMPVLNLSIGVPHFEPHFGRPYDIPLKGAPLPPENPLRGVARFVSLAGRIQKAEPALPVIGSGYSWLRQFAPNVAAAVIDRGWAALIGLGRNAIAYPDSVRDLEESGAFDKDKSCTTCSICSQLLRSGGPVGCPVRDAETYTTK